MEITFRVFNKEVCLVEKVFALGITQILSYPPVRFILFCQHDKAVKASGNPLVLFGTPCIYHSTSLYDYIAGV